MQNLIDFIPIIISILAIIYTVASFNLQQSYSEKEYKYKLPARLTFNVYGRRRIYNDLSVEYDINEYNINIVEENNLDDIFIINSNNDVYPVNYIEKIKQGIKKDEIIKSVFDKELPSITTEKYKYYYNFVILKSLDNKYEIYTFISKNSTNSKWALYSSEQLYSFEKYNENNIEYKGEVQILNQYKNIIKWLKENKI